MRVFTLSGVCACALGENERADECDDEKEWISIHLRVPL